MGQRHSIFKHISVATISSLWFGMKWCNLHLTADPECTNGFLFKILSWILLLITVRQFIRFWADVRGFLISYLVVTMKLPIPISNSLNKDHFHYFDLLISLNLISFVLSNVLSRLQIVNVEMFMMQSMMISWKVGTFANWTIVGYSNNSWTRISMFNCSYTISSMWVAAKLWPPKSKNDSVTSTVRILRAYNQRWPIKSSFACRTQDSLASDG